jgi:hypothetical protein
MSLDKLNKWLTLLANLGVITGIIFLAVEVRNSNIATTNQMLDSVADGFISLNIVAISDTTVGETWVRGLSEPNSLSLSQTIRFSMHMRALFNQFKRIHGLYRAGLLPESEWALYAREAASIMTMPGGEQHWAHNEIDPIFKADILKYAGQAHNLDFILGRELSYFD